MQCGANPQGALPCVTELAALPGWWGLPAVKSGCVFVVDHAPFLRPGPRLVRSFDVASCTASLCLTPEGISSAPWCCDVHLPRLQSQMFWALPCISHAFRWCLLAWPDCQSLIAGGGGGDAGAHAAPGRCAAEVS